MNYNDWNEIIANYFFNPGKCGDEVFLFITKKEIINIGRIKLATFTDEHITFSDEHIWKDYLKSIRKGASTSRKKYVIEQANEEFNSWSRSKKGLPFYISYLTLLVLPITESSAKFNSNNYYDKLDEFLSLNNFVGEEIERLNEIDELWNDLENWSKIIMNGELGNFEVKEFKGNYKYVGKVFSQILFPPKIIRKLPELFLKAELIPNTNYSCDTFQEILIRFNIGLNDNSIQTLKDKNDLGVTIIEIVKREYDKWNGESNEIVVEGEAQIVKRNYFTARLYSQFKINSNEGFIKFSYRLKTSNEFPDDLVFADKKISYESNDWSNTIQFEFKESLELKDEYNKWIAKFLKKDIRVFIRGNNFQLSSDYWIESDKLSKYEWNYVLCHNKKKDKLIEWGSHFKNENFIVENLKGIPNDYSLFKLLGPRYSLIGIPELTVYTHKSIELKGGLRIDGRKYLNIYLPEIEVINSEGNESIYLIYDDLLEKVTLKKKIELGNVWLLPNDILLNKKFVIKLQDEITQTANYKYEILNNTNSFSDLNKKDLNKRNKYGELIDDEESNYIQGVIPESFNFTQQEPYLHLIKPNVTIPFIINIKGNQYKYQNSIGNSLISYITYKKNCTTEEFHNAFKFIYDRSRNDNNPEQRINIPTQKHLLLNYYDNLGFIDYDYETKKISVINPQFINLPTNFGRKILLTGGRDQSLVENLVKCCNELKLSIELIERDTYFRFLPDIITITSYDSVDKQFGELKIIELAKKLDIEYQEKKFIPFGLQDFSSNIKDYENHILKNKSTDTVDYNWARKIFNYDYLEFEKNELNEFEKEYTLVEYKLNEYTRLYKIWINGECYIVDRNWGKYLIINSKQRNYILGDKVKEKIAIPVMLPLPKYLYKSIYLLSSKLPGYKQLSLNDKKLKYLIFDNIPYSFAHNLFKFKLNQDIQEYNL